MPKDTFSWKKTILKMVKFAVIIVIPWLVNAFLVSFPEWGQATVATVLYGLVNILKVRFGVKLP